ncbi:MAG: tetratricopeptide repeat protein [Alcaligenaceae bacterium]
MSDLIQNKITQVTPVSAKFLTGFELVKNGSIAIFAFATACVTAIGILLSITTSSVVFEPLLVPTLFVEQGYTPEITTTRVLDEISRINELSTSTKDKKNIGVKQPGDQLANLQAVHGVDLRMVQSVVQDVLGIKKEKIAGEITFQAEKDRVIYQIRIRSLPKNTLLVDFKTSSSIPEVIKETAIKLIEKMDPAVAASYYRWSKDIDSSLRLVDEALRNNDSYDDNYALVGRAQIYIARKKFDLAQQDLDQIFKTDPKFVPAMNTQSYLFNEQKQYEKAMEFALRAKSYWPERWQPHVNIGHAADGLGKKDEAEAAYRATIAYNPTWPSVYDELAVFFLDRGKRDFAEQIYHKGLLKFPTNPDLLFHYGQFLLTAGRQEQALNYLLKAYRVNPENGEIWIEVLKLAKATKDPVLLEVREKAEAHLKSNVAASNQTFTDLLNQALKAR